MAAGKLDAAFTYQRLITLGKAGDEVMGVGLAGRGFDFGLARARSSIGDVVGDGATEEQHILRHNRDLPAEFEEFVLTRIFAVNKDSAAVRIVETQEQRHHR
jgi:hypothetical protein